MPPVDPRRPVPPTKPDPVDPTKPDEKEITCEEEDLEDGICPTDEKDDTEFETDPSDEETVTTEEGEEEGFFESFSTTTWIILGIVFIVLFLGGFVAYSTWKRIRTNQKIKH